MKTHKTRTKSSALTLKRLSISIACALGIFIVSWLHINSYHSFTIEDSFFSKISFFKYDLVIKSPFLHKIFYSHPKQDPNVIFINTGNDLQLINDTDGRGNIAVTDRVKLLWLLNTIQKARGKPKSIVLDLDFYAPYQLMYPNNISPDSEAVKNTRGSIKNGNVDEALNKEIANLYNLIIGVKCKTSGGKTEIDIPQIKSTKYGTIEYITYGLRLNKFKIHYNHDDIYSLPELLMPNSDSGFSGPSLATFYKARKAGITKGRLCFNFIWPTYYFNKTVYNKNDLKNRMLNSVMVYTLNTVENTVNSDSVYRDTVFKNKILMIGNFSDDMHETYNGRIAGTLILWDVYLSMLNGQQFVSIWWFILVIVPFTFLSYCAIYASLPKYLYHGKNKLLKISMSLFEDITYVFVLTITSVFSTLIFNVPISILIPAIILFLIEKCVPKKLQPA